MNRNCTKFREIIVKYCKSKNGFFVCRTIEYDIFNRKLPRKILVFENIFFYYILEFTFYFLSLLFYKFLFFLNNSMHFLFHITELTIIFSFPLKHQNVVSNIVLFNYTNVNLLFIFLSK